MNKYTTEELREVLELHKKWLNNHEDGICANLRNADLSGTDLRNVQSFFSTIGEMKFVKSMQCEKYMIAYTTYHMNIGCHKHSIEDWKNFSDEQISDMDDGALEWWTKWKPILMQIIEISPAEPM